MDTWSAWKNFEGGVPKYPPTRAAWTRATLARPKVAERWWWRRAARGGARGGRGGTTGGPRDVTRRLCDASGWSGYPPTVPWAVPIDAGNRTRPGRPSRFRRGPRSRGTRASSVAEGFCINYNINVFVYTSSYGWLFLQRSGSTGWKSNFFWKKKKGLTSYRTPLLGQKTMETS